MTILDPKYDRDILFTDMWDVSIVWYKYWDYYKINQNIKDALNKDAAKWFAWFENFDGLNAKELIEFLIEFVPPHTKELDDIKYNLIVSDKYEIDLKNASGRILSISFKKKYEDKLRTTEQDATTECLSE